MGGGGTPFYTNFAERGKVILSLFCSRKGKKKRVSWRGCAALTIRKEKKRKKKTKPKTCHARREMGLWEGERGRAFFLSSREGKKKRGGRRREFTTNTEVGGKKKLELSAG